MYDYIMNAEVRELCGVLTETTKRILGDLTTKGKLT